MSKMSKEYVKYNNGMKTAWDEEQTYYENLNKLIHCCGKYNLSCFFDTFFAEHHKRKCKIDIKNQNGDYLYAIYADVNNTFEFVDKTNSCGSVGVHLTMDDILKLIIQNNASNLEFVCPKKIVILGSVYSVEIKKVADDYLLSKNAVNGYTDCYAKKIILADLTDEKEFAVASHYSETRYERYKQTLRHEITHAFIYECGLGWQMKLDSGAWYTNEPLVDWIAIQGPKLHEIWVKNNLI